MSGAARARRTRRTLQERINELQVRAAKEKKKADLMETMAQARRELQGTIAAARKELESLKRRR